MFTLWVCIILLFFGFNEVKGLGGIKKLDTGGKRLWVSEALLEFLALQIQAVGSNVVRFGDLLKMEGLRDVSIHCFLCSHCLIK